MRILLLNGPPRCGKDTAAQMIKDYSSSEVHLEKFALPMKLAVPLIYGVTQEEWKKLDSSNLKDYPCDQFFGMKPRDVQISFSEHWLKVNHGKTVFGELLARRIQKIQDRFASVVVSDSGFRPEAEVLVNKFGADNIWLLRITKPECDYSSDSRGYIDLRDLGVVQYDIENSGGLDDFRSIILGMYNAFSLLRDSKPVFNEIVPEDLDKWKARQKTMADRLMASTLKVRQKEA